MKGLAAVVFPALLAACATPVTPRAPEAVVKDRSQTRWNALVQGDVKTAYEFFSPGSRATMSLADFASGIKVGFWKAVSVDKVECGSDSCDVSTTIEYEFRGSRIKTPSRETWVRDGADWWFLRR
jgi:phospholipase C